jgi:uncharacterized membrane protein
MATVEGMLLARREMFCHLCEGHSHTVKTCGLLRYMNRATKDTPGLRAAWGTKKAEAIGKSVGKTLVVVTAARKKRVAKAMNKEAARFYEE